MGARCADSGRTQNPVAAWRCLRWRCSSSCRSGTSTARISTGRRGLPRLRRRAPTAASRRRPVTPPSPVTITARSARRSRCSATRWSPRRRSYRCRRSRTPSPISTACRCSSWRAAEPRSNPAPRPWPDRQLVLGFGIAALFLIPSAPAMAASLTRQLFHILDLPRPHDRRCVWSITQTFTHWCCREWPSSSESNTKG
jgi:hypothetical protein